MPISTITSSSSIDTRLWERWFGDWDGNSDVHYQNVWNRDALDPHHTQNNVELVWSAVDQATALVYDWDQVRRGRHS